MWILTSSIVRGLSTTSETLNSLGLHVSGTILKPYFSSIEKDHPLDSDLETCRRLITFTMDASKLPSQSPAIIPSRTLALIEGNGPDYSHILARLLVLKGLKVIVVHLNFSIAYDKNEKGILQHLDGEVPLNAIIKKGAYDTISSGGVFRYANELIGSKTFATAISTLQNDYDLIIICSNALFNSAEAESLLDIFRVAAVTLKDLPINDLKDMIALAKDPKHHITFIFDESDQL